jgi:unsaturated chondroitin disaccharide hydrolase
MLLKMKTTFATTRFKSLTLITLAFALLIHTGPVTAATADESPRTQSQASLTQTVTADELLKRIPEIFKFTEVQYQGLLTSIRHQTNQPRTFENGTLGLVPPRDWTSGFFPGSLWLVYEYTRDPQWLAAARDYTERLESIKTFRGTHDLGFMLGCSYGNGFRLTDDPAYRAVLLEGAHSLGSRFDSRVGLIRSWDFGQWQYPVIIDNMMNLELLTWSSHATGNSNLRDIAVQHADKTLQNHFRPDGSSFHLVDYDSTNGAVLGKQTVQGAADTSAWSRGQAWALHGYTTMYRETRRPEYLAQAGRVARFMMNHPRLPTDKIPYWDFDASDIPNAPRDASAAAVMSSALIELSGMVDAEFGSKCLDLARQQLLSLSSPAYLAKVGENGGFILKHSTGHKPKNSEVDVPLNYADYYFLEALLRYRRVNKD